MIGHLLTAVLSLSGVTAYLVIGALACGESAAFVGLFLPGETALLFGGVLAGRGQVNLLTLLVVVSAAAVLGDSIGYEFGRRAGPPLRSSRAGRAVGEHRWSKAEHFLERRGGAAIFLGRWVGLLRALVPTLAGMGRMPYRIFLPWNVAGAVTWASTVVLLGYAFAGSVTTLTNIATGAGSVATALVVVALVASVATNQLRTRRPAGSRRSAIPNLRVTSWATPVVAMTLVVALGAALGGVIHLDAI